MLFKRRGHSGSSIRTVCINRKRSFRSVYDRKIASHFGDLNHVLFERRGHNGLSIHTVCRDRKHSFNEMQFSDRIGLARSDEQYRSKRGIFKLYQIVCIGQTSLLQRLPARSSCVLQDPSVKAARKEPQKRCWLTEAKKIFSRCIIYGLPFSLRMFRVKSDKSEWFWSQYIVFTKPFKKGMSLDSARGRDSWC